MFKIKSDFSKREENHQLQTHLKSCRRSLTRFWLLSDHSLSSGNKIETRRSYVGLAMLPFRPAAHQSPHRTSSLLPWSGGQDIWTSMITRVAKQLSGLKRNLYRQYYTRHLKVRINPLTTSNDKDLISPHSIAAKSIIKVTGIKEIIATKGAVYCSTNSLRRYNRG